MLGLMQEAEPKLPLCQISPSTPWVIKIARAANAASLFTLDRCDVPSFQARTGIFYSLFFLAFY